MPELPQVLYVVSFTVPLETVRTPISAVFRVVPAAEALLAGLAASGVIPMEALRAVLGPYLKRYEPYTLQLFLDECAKKGEWPSAELDTGGGSALCLSRLLLR